jgi:transcription antitermination factor NusG
MPSQLSAAANMGSSEASLAGAAIRDVEMNGLMPSEMQSPHWYAAYTCARHEKSVARQLEARGVDFFLPLYRSLRRWKDRRKQLDLALFPGYVFVHIPLENRLRVLDLPGMVRLVSFRGKPAPLPEQEIETLRNGLTQEVYVEPHPYLQIGRRVRVEHGPLAGLQGFLLRRKDKCRVVVSLDLIQRSIAAEVDAADVQPLN